MFSCKFCKISKNAFFREHVWETASPGNWTVIQLTMRNWFTSNFKTSLKYSDIVGTDIIVVETAVLRCSSYLWNCVSKVFLLIHSQCIDLTILLLTLGMKFTKLWKGTEGPPALQFGFYEQNRRSGTEFLQPLVWRLNPRSKWFCQTQKVIISAEIK